MVLFLDTSELPEQYRKYQILWLMIVTKIRIAAMLLYNVLLTQTSPVAEEALDTKPHA